MHKIIGTLQWSLRRSGDITPSGDLLLLQEIITTDLKVKKFNDLEKPYGIGGIVNIIKWLKEGF